MTKLDILKGGISLVVGIGVNQIIGSTVQLTTPTDTVAQKLAVQAGRLGIVMLVSDAVSKHLDSKIDAFAAWYKTNITEVSEA